MQGQEAPRVTTQCPLPIPKADTKTERLKDQNPEFLACKRCIYKRLIDVDYHKK